jgi:hypothetical protein
MAIQKARFIPHDQFDHSFGLLEENDTLDIESIDIKGNPDMNTRFASMISKPVQLGNIGEKMLPFEQEKVRILTDELDMARRSKYFIGFFRRRYYAWVNEIKLTRAGGGLERKLQASVSSPYTPREAILGYQGTPEEQLQKKNAGMINDLFGMLGIKPKQPQQPQQQG